ncbi:transporter substrate-binding domain-containing protein [Pigmentibacter sp. JX0631]|uniref:transporter substrate-binding domain-containing protein n=1 Tax=Pigmentibacter sp. JX0631 TaxID=2976982 RepID=UPI002468311F|nr:transporter substrate-binding domain-containing protein [Pigmentibacter sp. JX0631]WGL59234.1 transporter substrate-binding domain-containing protein [Pigmentibacter sp. JX0631]
MNNLIKFTLFLISSGFLISKGYAQELSTFQKIKTESKFTTCTAGGFPPFSVHGKDGWVGFDIDMIKSYANFLKVKYEIIDYHFDGIIPALNTKKCDMIVSGMTITDERKKSVLFSNSYFKDGISTLMKKNNSALLNDFSFEKLNSENIKIGVRLGYTSDFYVGKNYKKAKILKFNETVDLINALKNNQIDVIFTDTNNAVNISSKFSDSFIYKNTEVQDEYFGVAFRLKDKDLMENFNQFLSSWTKTKEYTEIYEKHLVK